MKLLELSMFEPLVGQTFVFSITDTDLHHEAVLTEAIPIKSAKPPDVERDPFALAFRFSPDVKLEQGTLEVRTASGQEFPPMFLVPYRDGEDGWMMEACFG